jgi:cysteine desulfurase
MGEEKRIYCDTAAATHLDKEVFSAMYPFFTLYKGNAGALHKEGEEVKRAIEKAREQIASALGVKKTEIFFTSGGTESNNMALLGVIDALSLQGRKKEEMHIIIGPTEHASVLSVAKKLETLGVSLTIMKCNREGLFSLSDFEKELRKETVLVSCLQVNNEIGTLYPISKMQKKVKDYAKKNNTKIFFHTDASQSMPWMNVQANSLGIDLLTIGAQKVWGPQGIGALFVKEGTPIVPIVFGGSQENKLRPGTVPTALVVGCGESVERAQKYAKERGEKVEVQRDYFISRIKKEIKEAVLNGPLGKDRSPNNAHFSFPSILGDEMVLRLDAQGIACSTKSACHKNDEGSTVMDALCAKEEEKKSAVRFTFDKTITKEEIDRIVSCINVIYKKYSS